MFIYWPPLPTQRKIAATFSAYDDLIENNTRRIAILEEMAQSLYREWFVHFRFPGHEKKRMVESPLGMIPEGWEVVKLREICFITMGQSPSSEFYNTKEDGLPFHQGVADFGERFPKDRVYCTAVNRIAEAGDILFSVRAPVGRINLAGKKIVIGRGLCAIRSKTGNQCFVFQQLKELFQEEDTIGNGAIFKAVTKEDMYGIKMIQPPQPIVMSFEQQIQPIFSNLEVLIRKNAKRAICCCQS
jgi:type I restriction enzyme S subunit